MKYANFLSGISLCITIAVILPVTTSCVKQTKQHEVSRIEVDLSNISHNIRLSQIFKDFRAIKLETSSESLVGDFNKITIHENKIYISTGPSVFIFSDSGQFIKTIQMVGRGPGEYSNIYDLLINKNGEVEILDAGLKKVNVYDKDFNFIRSYTTDSYAMNFAISNNGMTVFHCGNDNAGKTGSKVLLFEGGKLRDNFIKIDSWKAKYLHVRGYDVMSYYNDKVAIAEAYGDTIYYVDGEICYPKYHIDIGEKGIPEKSYQKNYRDIADFILNFLNDSGYAYGIFGFLESSSQLFFSYYEKVTDESSPYGIAKKYYVLYDKSKMKSSVSYNLVDDISSTEGVKIDNTTFFSQTDGSVVFGMPGFEFLKTYLPLNDRGLTDANEKTVQTDVRDYLTRTNMMDNPIIFIASLK